MVEGGARRVGPVELIDADQEAAEGLARAGRGGDQGVLAGGDGGPAAQLRWGRPVGKATAEPGPHRGVEAVEHRMFEEVGLPAQLGLHGHGGDPTQGVRQSSSAVRLGRSEPGSESAAPSRALTMSVHPTPERGFGEIRVESTSIRRYAVWW